MQVERDLCVAQEFSSSNFQFTNILLKIVNCEIGNSRAMREFSGERVSNTLVTYPKVGHSSPKGGVIPDVLRRRKRVGAKAQAAMGWA